MKMKVEEHIKCLIDLLGKDYQILKYVYNNKFIPGETPIYYSGPYWGDDEVVEAIKTLLTGKWLSSGEKVREFENAFTRKINNRYGLMVNSGSSANLVMFAALKKVYNWKDDDELILSVVGFPTTLAPIIQNQLKPVFVDIEMDSLNFDVDKIEEKITSKTKAIVLSPVLGNAPDMDKIKALCDKHKIQLVLDNCDSLGSKWKGKYLNQYAVASTNSFYPSHHISTGEGGMVVSDNKELINTARSIAWWGRDCYCVGAANLISCGSCGNRFDKWLDNYDGIIDHKYLFVNVGYNLKPLDMQGSIGLVQLKKFDEIHTKRRHSKNKIHELLEKHLVDVYVPGEIEHAETSWFGTPIICPNKEYKDNLVEFLESMKIQTRNYFAGNILLHPAYKDLDSFDKYPEANKVLDQVFFIGAAPHYGDEVFTHIENCLKEFANVYSIG